MNQKQTGLDISIDATTMEFHYGPGVRGPKPEFRTLDAIRPSLLDPQCSGPSPVYSIAMDVRHPEDEEDLQARYLLFGVVAYAAGQLGQEPVRSQGHVHAIAPHSGWSPPELYEIWEGKAIVYAQEFATDDPGRCFAITASPGDIVVVPPGWAHATVNADPSQRMVFGAWCDREYGFDYTGVRAHSGLAYYPLITENGSIEWAANHRYQAAGLVERASRPYPELGLNVTDPIYTQYHACPQVVQWVSHPQLLADLWPHFEP